MVSEISKVAKLKFSDSLLFGDDAPSDDGQKIISFNKNEHWKIAQINYLKKKGIVTDWYEYPLEDTVIGYFKLTSKGSEIATSGGLYEGHCRRRRALKWIIGVLLTAGAIVATIIGSLNS